MRGAAREQESRIVGEMNPLLLCIVGNRDFLFPLDSSSALLRPVPPVRLAARQIVSTRPKVIDGVVQQEVTYCTAP